MNFSLYIAKRYLASKSSNNAINIITIIATIGVVVGSLALFIVLSVFSGLKSFSASLLNGTDPDIRIVTKKGKSFEFTTNIENTLKDTKGIISYSKVVEERAFFKYKKKQQVAYLKGVDENYTKVTNIDSILYLSGDWIDFKKNTSVVGLGIANKLSVGVATYGNPLKIYVPKPGKKYIVNPLKAFKQINTDPIGYFSVSEELNNKYVFTSLSVAQKLLGYSQNEISFIDIKANDKMEVIDNLKESLENHFKVLSQEQLNATFYKILNTEKLVAYLIFTLVLIIALFNVIGSVIMMILDKKDNLKTLYNIGANLKEIKNIFMLQGFLLSLFSLIVGITLGSILIFAQNQFHLFMINDFIPYPIEFKLINVVIVSITIILLGYLSSIIASRRISKSLIH